MSRVKVLETFVILGLAAVVCYLITDNKWLVWTAGTILLVAVFDNPLARVVTKCWLKLSELLNKVMSKVILMLVFYIFLVPVAVLYRLFNSEVSSHFKKRSRNSFFVEIRTPFTKKSFENPW